MYEHHFRELGVQPGFEIIGAKSKKGSGEEPPAHAPMAPRGPGRTSLSGDQKKVRRQMAKSAGAIDTIESMLSGLEPDQLQELWDLASEEQRKATDRKTQDAIATARGAIMRQFQKWGMEPVTATTAASDFQGGGMLHALWIKILEWIIGHNGYSDYADEYAFASLRPQGNKETTVDTSIQREAALLNEMDGASLDRQRKIAAEIEAIGRARVAAFEADREIDFGGAVVRDTLTPVVVAAVHTSSTDWLDEAVPERDLAEVQRSMTTAASAFYTRVHEAAKADPEEYRIQAQGMASLVAGAHAPYIREATDAFMRHALFLNRSAMVATAVTLTDGNIESEAERVAEEAREQAWGDILDMDGEDIEDMVDSICNHRYSGDPLAKQVADRAVDIVISGSKRTAADADINKYPANEQAGYAESGLPASVPVEGYDAEGISDEGAFENYAPKVAPENAAAEAEEGDRTPMPGFGEQVTSAVDAGMRSVDTPLWGFQSVAQRQVVAQQHTAAGIPESVGNGESYPLPCVVINDHGRKSNYQYQADVIWSPATLATVAQGFDKAEVLAQAQSYASNEGLPLYDGGKLIQNPQALASRRTAADGMTCATCGDSITRDPEGEEPRTYHHTNGTSHDHEAKPSGSTEASLSKSAIDWKLTHEEPNWVTDDGDVATTPNGTIPMEYVAKVPEGELRVYNVIGGWLWQINGKNPNAAPLVEFNGANGDPFGPRDGLDLDEAKSAVERAYVAWSGKRASKTASINLTNVGIVDRDGGICKGTDPSGNVVHFKVSPKEMSDLSSVLFSDLSVNFSGVTIEESDLVSQASKTAGTDPDDQAGTAESGSSTPETNSETMWPWELPEGETKSGEGASDVAAVPTPGQDVTDYPQAKGASRDRAIEPTEAVQPGDTVRVIGGFEDGVTGQVTRGGWYESHAYGYTVASNNALTAYYIDVAGTEIGPFRSGDIEKV